MAEAQRRFIDYIMELKLRCRFEEEIGEECRLAPREVSCLSALSPGESVSARELAGRVGLSPSRASRLIMGLRTKGMILEAFDEKDRRAVSIRLTPSGERLIQRIEAKKNECEKRLLSAFNREQLRVVRNGLATLSLAFEGGAHETVRDN
ncbi:MAG TPA: MarR family transcriptional regulator [Spirochaetia bacterium]|nr:MarR family transcriptional regulator [Spirochaetia bacterium]